MIEFLKLKPIKEYENLYSVNQLGEIFSHKSNRSLQPYKSADGYMRVNLSRDGKVKIKMVHRLVAETFLPNPEGLPVVNHIDGDKSNPKLSNLEWVSVSGNAIHAFDNGLHVISDKHRAAARKVAAENGAKTTSKKIIQLDLLGNEIDRFPSVRAAERETNVARSNIIRVCKSCNGSAGGFEWRYAE